VEKSLEKYIAKNDLLSKWSKIRKNTYKIVTIKIYYIF